MSDITRVGVIGGGLMASGIAEVCARAGLDVVVREIDDAAAAAGQRRIERSMGRGVKAGSLSEADRDAAAGRITVTTDLAALADRDLVMRPRAGPGQGQRQRRRQRPEGKHFP